MRFRPKVFLAFLALSITPLLLIALANYWSNTRTAEASLKKTRQRDLANFNHEIEKFLTEDKDEITRFSRSPVLREYIDKSIQNDSEAAVPPSTAEFRMLEPQPPIELKAYVSCLINNRTHVSNIAVFREDSEKALLSAERREYETHQPVGFDAVITRAKADERVWKDDQSGVFNTPASTSPSGSFMVFTAPVYRDSRDTRPKSAVVAEVDLKHVFEEAARIGNGSPQSLADVFLVVDHSGKILYYPNEAVKNQPVSSLPFFAPITAQMSAKGSGEATYTGPNGDLYATTYEHLPALDIFVARASDNDEALSGVRRSGKAFIGLAVLLGLAAATVSTFYWHRKSRGIKRVSEGVGAIAGGQLDHQFDLRSRDDLRPLVDNVELVTKQLRDQIAREAETHQFQSFVRLSAILTHDLKNAIEALSLTVSNMERHSENAEFRADTMKNLSGATENLRALVARLSNPITTLSGEHKLPRSVDLVPMLKRVVAKTADVNGGPHQVELKLPESLFALVDVERMDKVVENLVINAREAMPGKPGTITIEAGRTADNKPFFSVCDTGEGMSRHFIDERLFHPFATTKKRGVGLGLYTCREVVRANGGSIEVHSTEGVGTTFMVVLPSPPIERDRKVVSKTHQHS